MRRWLRRVVPWEVRLRIALMRRGLRDTARRTRFASERGNAEGHRFAEYSLVIRHYPGQEALAEGKRRNQALLGEALDAVAIRSGETFSLWRLAGRPTRERGYLEGAATIEGRLTSDIGGATCLLATVVYNTALLGGLEVTERACHSVDTYGDDRYFEIGRDAVIEYGFRDLRFRNPHAQPVVLHVATGADRVAAWLSASEPLGLKVSVEVGDVAHREAQHGFHVTRRLTDVQGNQRVEDLGWSWYSEPPEDDP